MSEAIKPGDLVYLKAGGPLMVVGVIDVKSYYIETPEDVAERIRKILPFVPAEKLAIAPDCGMSQTARWATKLKLANMVAGAKLVRATL